MPQMIFQIANTILTIISLAVIVRAFLSWVYPVGKDPYTRILLDITEPLLAPIRSVLSRLLPLPIDFSPIVVILLIQFLQNMLQSAYYRSGS